VLQRSKKHTLLLVGVAVTNVIATKIPMNKQDIINHVVKYASFLG